MWRIVRLDRTSFGQKLGRRGLVLIFSGLAWVLIGLQIVQHPDVPRFANPNAPATSQIVLHILDSSGIGYLWAVCGVGALLVGLFHHRPVLRQHDSVGFNFILLPPLTWMLGFIYSFGTAILTGGALGRYESLYAAIVWLIISLFIIVIAGWPEASPEVRASLNKSARRRLGLHKKRQPGQQ